MIDYRVIRRPNRKTASLQVSPSNQVSIIVPPDLPDDRIAAIVKSKTRLILSKIAFNNEVKYPVRPREFVSGESFAYLGRHYRLKVDPGVARTELRGGYLQVTVPNHGRADEAALVRLLLREWFMERARLKLNERVKRLARRLAVDCGRVTVKDLRSRWGSCAHDGGLVFNWRIVMAPLRLIDYVILHELCHLTHHDHSPEFWQLLERRLPDALALKEELRRVGALLDF